MSESRQGQIVAETKPGEGPFVLLLFLVSIGLLIEAIRIPQLENSSSPGAFSIIVTSLMAVCTALLLSRNWRRYFLIDLANDARLAVRNAFPKTVIVFMTLLVGYVAVIQPLHFWASSFAYLGLSFYLLQKASVVKSVSIAAFILVCIYLIFQYIFQVVLW